MKLCLVAPYPPPYGGIANWVNLINKYINTMEKDIRVIPLNIAPKKRSMEGRNLWDRVARSGLDMLYKRQMLKKIIKNEEPDVIHMTTSGQLAIIRDILLLKLAKKAGTPTVYHIRFGRIPQISQKKTLEWKMIRYAMKLASQVIVIDSDSYNSINQEIKVLLMPNPIDFSDLPQVSLKPNTDVVFVGWNVKTKGIEELILAWNKVGRMFPKYKLRLIGPGNEEYVTYLKSLCHVENSAFEGEVSHGKTLDIIRECCIFILPSYTEGFPNAVVEAMALKKPIIATSVGAITDMLANNCGLLIEKESVKQIEDALVRFIENSEIRINCAQNAYDKAYKEYDIGIVFESYKSIWNRLIDKSKAGRE